jgi:hypothetical protein
MHDRENRMKSLLLTCALALAAIAPTQNRVFLGPTPTNLSLDLGNAFVVPDPLVSNALLVLTPLSAVSAWAAFDAVDAMNFQFGSGNWLRCRMTAIEWAYLSDSACAHAPAPGSPVPLSLLTTTYDYGAYTGQAGTPFSPFPNSTRFPANFQSFVSGLPAGGGLSIERWQLRTRGFFTNELWNGCGPSPGQVTPTFPGFLLARISYVFN